MKKLLIILFIMNCVCLSYAQYEKLDSLMMTEYQKGEYAKALPYALQMANAVKTSNGADSSYAKRLSNVALLYDYMGEQRKAEASYLEILEIWAKYNAKKHPEYAKTLNNLATLYTDLREFEKAERLLLESIELRKKLLGDKHPDYAAVLNNLALLYKGTDQTEKAVNLYKEAINILKNKKEYLSAYASALNNLGASYRTLKKYEDAELCLAEVVKILEKKYGKNHPLYANALNSLALLYRDMGFKTKSATLFQESASINKRVLGERHPDHINSMLNLSSFYLFFNEADSAFLYCIKSIALNAGISEEETIKQLSELEVFNYKDRDKIIHSLNLLSRIYTYQRSKSNDLKYFERTYKLSVSAASIIDRNRKEFISESSKLLLLKKTKHFIELSLNAAIVLDNKKQEAFNFAELNKSVLLLDATKAHKARSMGEIPENLAKKELALQAEYDRLKKSALESKKESALQDITRQQNELDKEILFFKKELEKSFPKYYRLKYQNITVSAEKIHQFLNKDELLLEYFIGDSTVFLFSVSKTSLDLIKIPIDKSELSSLIKDFRKSLTDYSYIKNNYQESINLYCSTSNQLYRLLLEDALKNHKQIKKLIIVPDGELGHIPFEAFLTATSAKNSTYINMPYLLNRYAIQYNYSATVWKENREIQKKENNGRMLAMSAKYGNSNTKGTNRSPSNKHLRESLSELPAAKAEVNALSKILKGTFLSDFNCTEKNFKTKASEFAIIHLAMHGLLNTQYPLLSSLAFTEDGDSTEDNMLEAWEISHLKLNADLVVLSACETGYGKFEQGEGVMSLARSFMYAGVPSLVVSLWQVNDASTAEIMKLFYANLANGMDKAQALQQAKLSYIKTAGTKRDLMAHPAFWAAFIQLGDSRPIQLKASFNYNILILVSILTVIFITAALLLRKKFKKNRL